MEKEDERRMLAEVDRRLDMILGEIMQQGHLAEHRGPDVQSFSAEMAQIREFVDVGEEGLAYEYIVAELEHEPFVLSGKAAVALLELGLLFGFKTERPEDEWLRRSDQ